jgi:hypothetical protein
MRDLDADPPVAGQTGYARPKDAPGRDVIVDLGAATVEPIGMKGHSPLPSADVPTTFRISATPRSVQIVRSVRYDQPPQQHLSTSFRVVDARVPHRTSPTTRRGSAIKGRSAWVIGAALVVALATLGLWTGTAVFGADHDDAPGASASGTDSSHSRPIAPSSSTAANTHNGLVAESSSSGRGRATRVDVTAPRDGATVDRCLLVTGTSRALPVQHTLVVGTSRIGGDAGIRLTPVNGWARPGRLTSWTAQTLIEPTSVGRRFSVTVVEVPVSTVRRALDASADSSSWEVSVLPAGSIVRDTVAVAVSSSSTLCEG